MKLTELSLWDFRNIEQAGFVPHEGLTVIAGPNGQGKTNLLEAVWMLTGGKSFRGSKDTQLVREGQPAARLKGHTSVPEKETDIEISIAGEGTQPRGRRAKLNGVEYGRAAAIAGTFTAVVFEPGHLSLVKAGPEGRRRFLDAALCQLYPGYLLALRRYSRAVQQRNSLLKQFYTTPDASFLLDAFDEELVLHGAEIIRRRTGYLQGISPEAQRFYDELSGGREALTLTYEPCAGPDDLAGLLAARRERDIQAGFSTAGPHREDFEITVAGRAARAFGSQGQQRSAALCLKLAEASMAREITGSLPVMLLDDVLSELDEGRQQYLLTRMGEGQSIVTTCDSTAFKRAAGLVVGMREGRLETG